MITSTMKPAQDIPVAIEFYIFFKFSNESIISLTNTMSELCIHCGKYVTPRQQSLQCEPCERWIHRICGTGISQDVYCQAVCEDKNIDWYSGTSINGVSINGEPL